MVTPQQLKTLDKYVDVIYELVLDQINGLRLTPLRQVNVNRSIYVRMIGQALYEAPKLHTGMVSIRLIEQKLLDSSTKACQEHHHSRQKGGAAILKLVDRAITTDIMPTRDDILQLALKYCQVHYTTSKENEMLKKHQRKCSSEAAYRRSNIKLVHAPDLFTQRGKHSVIWKQAMKDKYQSTIDAYHNPIYEQIEFDWPEVIH